ncbi:hypothetical protein ACVI1J_005384 [Bradyrhizobium diazoefficiens]
MSLTGLPDLLQLDSVHPEHPVHHLAFDLAGDPVGDLRSERPLRVAIARQSRFGEPLFQPNLKLLAQRIDEPIVHARFAGS